MKNIRVRSRQIVFGRSFSDESSLHGPSSSPMCTRSVFKEIADPEPAEELVTFVLPQDQ